MTPEEQRIAIAEACGRKFYFDTKLNQHIIDEYVPDYLNDLNAMHEAEKWVDWAKYLTALKAVIDNPSIGNLIHATASERAEAFLKSIGKWKD